MFFYVLQVFDTDYREDILLALTSAGVKRATVIDGTNFDKVLENEFPLFTGLFRGEDDRERFSQLIFGLIDDEEVLSSVVKVLKQAGITNGEKEIYRLAVMKGEWKT